MTAADVMPYREFLAGKQRRAASAGAVVDPGVVHPLLHGWQARIVAWAVRAGRAAVWADTGLGKTLIQLEWARLSGRRALVVAPLAVCEQTVAEARRIGITARYVRSDTDAGPGIWVTNYEMTGRFDPAVLDAVVLDESSILKDVTSKTRDRLIAQFAGVPRRLACTATPAPNDVAELANHAEFLGVATRREMLSTWFVHDQDGWRVKGHARGPMFAWMATWAVAIRRPSDLGWPDDGYDLPPLRVIPHVLAAAAPAPAGQLFAAGLGGVTGRAAIRNATVEARCARAAELAAAEPGEPWVLWCGLNAEAAALTRLVPGAVNLHGALTAEAKAGIVRGFAAGRIRVLVTKPAIAGFGLNWQHCARMAFVGLSDSYESYYQAIRRCHRYGQARPVLAHVIVSAPEAQIAANVARKQDQAARLTDALVTQMRAAATWRIP